MERVNASNEAQDVINSIKESTTPTGNDFWNSSATYLIRYILANFDPNYNSSDPNKGKIIVDENNSFEIQDIIHGNAGNSFLPNNEWVKPWKDSQGQTYSEIRGNDKKLSALTDDQNINFTSGTGIKLLMPMYERHVEVEDLDRNFWVIGQSLAGISAFLFSSESPFTNTFERIVGEIIELWENILYLWVAYSLAMQDKQYYTDVHSEIVYISMNDDFETGYKRDNFSGDASAILALDDVGLQLYLMERLTYITAKYPHCHLCIIPVLRFDNYESDYYATEYYPGVLLVNRNQVPTVPTQELDEPNEHFNQRMDIYNLDKENTWTFKRFGHDTQGIITTLIDTSIYDDNYATYVNTQGALGFTYNNCNDLYYTNLNNVTSGMKISTVDQTNVFISNTDFLSNLSARNDSITYYTAVRSTYSPIANKSVLCTYDSENNQLIFYGVNINLYDVSLGCAAKSQEDSNIDNLITTIIWALNGSNVSRNVVSNQHYNPSEEASSYGTYTDATKWPLYGYTSAQLSGHNSIKMILPTKLNTNPNHKLGFSMGEIMTNRVGFHEKIEDIN